MITSLSTVTEDDIKMGTFGACASIPIGFITMKTSQFMLKSLGIRTQLSRSFFPLSEVLVRVSSSFFQTALKAFAVVYLILLVPIAEEWLFRGQIYSWQKGDAPKDESMSLRVYRVLSNGILFGAFHYSIFLGWAGVPIFLISTVTGIIFAALREKTDGLWAPIIGHSLNNTIVLLLVHLSIL